MYKDELSIQYAWYFGQYSDEAQCSSAAGLDRLNTLKFLFGLTPNFSLE